MAVARTTAMVSESFDSFLAPVSNKPVPNHLLETKIYSKVGKNAILQAKPSVIHYSGFELGKKITRTLRLANTSDVSQRMHILAPSTKYFYIKYSKKEKLVPGMFIEVVVEFTPDEWRYYYDCVRVHTRAEENLVIPIHAYPTMNTEGFPKDVHFPSVPLGERISKIIPLRCSIPVDFEFNLNFVQKHPAFTVEPMSGVISGRSEQRIKVSFSPTDFSTAHMKLQLTVSQFNMTPLVCSFTGTSEPGLAKRLMEKEWPEEVRPLRSAGVLDPVLIDPLGRTRLKKLKTRPWTPGDTKSQEIVKAGLRFPTAGLDTASAVSCVLLQQPGKLKAKQIREAVQTRKDATGSTKQMKETMFEYQVHQNIQEERQNQLRWCVRLGEDPITDFSKKQIYETRTVSEGEYRLNRGDPVMEEEYDRSCVGCELRRIHRQAEEVPAYEPKFDVLVNDEWSKRHMVTQKFIQAGRKVIVRLRANKNLSSLAEFVTGWRKGKFTREHTRSQLAESEEEKLFDEVGVSLNMNPEAVFPFAFPSYKSPDTKEDMDVDALGCLTVQKTTVKVKTHVPYYNLKVPQQYRILGYNPHCTAAASSGYVSPNLVRPLRVGAEDEIVNLVSSVPLTSINSPTPTPALEDGEQTKKTAEGERPAGLMKSPAHQSTRAEMAVQEPEAVPLVVPAAMFKPMSYHPMHIFNPAPGLQVFKPPLAYAEVDEDYHLCPLPRNRHAGKSATGKPGRKYLERQDIIPGVMTWKRFPCQPLVSMATNPTLSSVWVPRWSDPFSEDLVPTVVPALLDGLPDEDAMSDEELGDNGVDPGFKEIPVPTPEMVSAQFPTAESILREQDQQVVSHLSEMTNTVGSTKISAATSAPTTASFVLREMREKELNEFLRERQNRVGSRIKQRVQSINDAMSASDLVLE